MVHLPGWKALQDAFGPMEKSGGKAADAAAKGAKAGEAVGGAATKTASGVVEAGGVAGQNAGKAVAGATKAVVGTPVAGGAITGRFTTGFFGGFFKGLSGGGSGFVSFLLKPLDVTLHAAAFAVRTVRGNPWAAGAVAVVGGGVMVSNAMRKDAERRTQKQLLEQASAGTPTYQVSSADAAALEARMKQGGQNGGFAAAEAARGGADQLAARQ